MTGAAHVLAQETIDFKPGQTISAEQFNENFRRVRNAIRGFYNPAELTGNWSCNCKFPLHIEAGDPAPFGTVDATGFHRTPVSETLTFTANGDGTFSVQPTTFSLLSSETPAPQALNYSVMERYFFYGSLAQGESTFDTARIKKINDYHMVLIKNNGENGDVIFYDCLRANLPPAAPRNLQAELGPDRQVTLTWTDRSENETGFRIFRRNKVAGEWQEIGTVEAEIVTYQDSAPDRGAFWYYVVAYNDYGNSLPSNVARIWVR